MAGHFAAPRCRDNHLSTAPVARLACRGGIEQVSCEPGDDVRGRQALSLGDEPRDRAGVAGPWLTVFSDTFAAVLVALFIFPTLLVFGLSMESGPKLIFVTLPHLFEQMLGGRVLGSLFFLALLSVAFLSGLAALEVVIASISDDQRFNRITRNKALVIFGLLELGLMAFPAFNPELIAVLDMIFGSGMLALGSLIAILVFGWCINRSAAMQQISGGSTHWLFRVLYYWLRVVVPLMFIIIIIGFTWEAIAG